MNPRGVDTVSRLARRPQGTGQRPPSRERGLPITRFDGSTGRTVGRSGERVQTLTWGHTVLSQTGGSGLLDDDVLGDRVPTGQTDGVHLVVCGKCQPRGLFVGTNRALGDPDSAGSTRTVTVAVEDIRHTRVWAEVVFEQNLAEITTRLALYLFAVVIDCRHGLFYGVCWYISAHRISGTTDSLRGVVDPSSPGVGVVSGVVRVSCSRRITGTVAVPSVESGTAALSDLRWTVGADPTPKHGTVTPESATPRPAWSGAIG